MTVGVEVLGVVKFTIWEWNKRIKNSRKSVYLNKQIKTTKKITLWRVQILRERELTFLKVYNDSSSFNKKENYDYDAVWISD